MFYVVSQWCMKSGLETVACYTSIKELPRGAQTYEQAL